MSSVPSMISQCADIIEAAVHNRTAIARLTDSFALSLEDGYAVQAEVARRQTERGDRLIGGKLGLTARAKQIQMNVDQPGYGRLFASGLHPACDPVVVSELIHPRVEPEIVFVMAERLAGPGVTGADVVAATRAVCCGLEIIDSRYDGFSFTAADVMADNTSAARIVLGPTMISPHGIDLAMIGLLLESNGDQVATACGAASMGHPADAVAMYANWLGEQGLAIEPGWIVFSGGLTAAQPLNAGTSITASFGGGLGSVTVRGV